MVEDHESQTQNYYMIPIRFSDIQTEDEKNNYIKYLMSLKSSKAVTDVLFEQDLHSHFLIAKLLQTKISQKKNPSNSLTQLKASYAIVKRYFNTRIKKGGKLNKIKSDAKKYLEMNKKNNKNIFENLVAKTKGILSDDALLDIYENHYNYEMDLIQKNILLHKFSSLDKEQQMLFVSLLFSQPTDIIKKVISCQSLHDLEHLCEYSIPEHQKKLNELSQMIMDYVNSLRFAAPHLKAEKYLNNNKELLRKLIPQIGNQSFEQCQIDPTGTSYTVHLMNQDIVNSIEEVDENVIMHYAVESTIDNNLESLKQALFPQMRST